MLAGACGRLELVLMTIRKEGSLFGGDSSPLNVRDGVVRIERSDAPAINQRTARPLGVLFSILARRKPGHDAELTAKVVAVVKADCQCDARNALVRLPK